MFSGIIQELGTVEKLESNNGILEITVLCKKIANELNKGDSVAIDGCCQTVIYNEQNLFIVQATDETLKKTNFNKLTKGSKVNLETSLRLGNKIDGHLVTGHIDATGEIKDILSFDDNKIIKIKFSKDLSNYITSKGSIAVNGVSLTVIDVKDNEFSFTLIPYTRDNTNIGLIKIGDPVNLEVDLVSRYLVNYMQNNLQLVKR